MLIIILGTIPIYFTAFLVNIPQKDNRELFSPKTQGIFLAPSGT